MPSDQIQANFSDLQQASSQFNSKAAELEQLLSQVQSQIQALSDTWKGQAASNFAMLMAKWASDVQGIHDILGAVSQHLTRAATEYEQTDVAIGNSFK